MTGKIATKLRNLVSLTQMSPLARQVRREGLTYLSPTKLANIEAELERLSRQGISGDFAEFGVALGGSAILIASRAGSGRRFHGFDVFAMIPEPTSEKDGEYSRKRYAEIKSGGSKGIGGGTYYGYRTDLFEAVSAAFAGHGLPVDGEQFQLHRGLFQDTWPKISPDIQGLAFVHIDCDWYDPVKYCLELCAEKMVVGGSIIVDDYFAYEGARSATDEFIAANREFVIARSIESLIITRVK